VVCERNEPCPGGAHIDAPGETDALGVAAPLAEKATARRDQTGHSSTTDEATLRLRYRPRAEIKAPNQIFLSPRVADQAQRTTA
jgi:hypothetical protein